MPPTPSASPLEYPFPDSPAPGAAAEVAPGVRWLRMKLPFALDHINVWALEDDKGWTIVDTGLGNAATRELWNSAFGSGIKTPVRRVIVTHYHPDHAGNAGWLCERFGAALWMSRAEYLTVHAARHGAAGYSTEAQIALFRANGLSEATSKELLARGDLYRRLVPEFPFAHKRIFEDEEIAIGGRRWRVLFGYGHSPEHASLYCAETNVLRRIPARKRTALMRASAWPSSREQTCSSAAMPRPRSPAPSTPRCRRAPGGGRC